MTHKKPHSDAYIAGDGIETSQGVVLLAGEFKCRVCGKADVFEWPNPCENEKDLEGLEALGLITAVAQSQNWIVQKVMDVHEGKQILFVLCPTCLEIFLSATTTSGLKKDQ